MLQSHLSILQYMGLCVFSLPISLVMIERIYVLCLIIIIKSEVWAIILCLGLGHETMVCAVCLSIFLSEVCLQIHRKPFARSEARKWQLFSRVWPKFNQAWDVKVQVSHSTHLIPKSLVWFQNAWFCAKMPCPTQKCPHRIHQLTLPLSNTPLLIEIIFSNFIQMFRLTHWGRVTHIANAGKKYGIFFISSIFRIFVECVGCFCTWNTFLRADITFGGVD